MNRARDLLVAGDDEIGGGVIAGGAQLGADAGIGQVQIGFFDFGEEFFCAGVELRRGVAVVFVVVLGFDVAGGGSDESCAPEGFGEVRAEGEHFGVGERIDESVDERGARAADFTVFAAHGIDFPAMIAEQRGDLVGMKAGGVDDAAGCDGFALGVLAAADAQLGANGVFSLRFERGHLRVGDDAGALFGGDAGVRFYDFLGGEDARAGNFESGHAGDVRLAGANGGGVKDAHAGDAVGFAAALEIFQFGGLVGVGGDEEFSGAAMGNVVGGAEFVGEAIAFEAVARFEGVSRVVEAGMDHAAVARAGGHAGFGKRFDEKDVVPAGGEFAGDGAADDSAADDEDVGLVHGVKRIRQEEGNENEEGEEREMLITGGLGKLGGWKAS